MALTTPILYSVPAFDSLQAQTFTFNVIGGSQVVANTLTIKDNATLSTVYSQTQTTFKFEHTLPTNTLTNGTYYQATLSTKDAQGNESTESAPIQFYCYTQPTFSITNMPLGNIVQNASYSFTATYNQIQGELLNAYVFNLYNSSGALIDTSSTLYTTSSSLPTSASYLFSGFDDKSSYSVEVNGITVGGTNITTGKVVFTTRYEHPSAFSLFYLSNNCQDGYISIESNIVNIDGTSEPESPTYIDGKEIDLRQDGAYVTWKEGFVVPRDFTLRLWGRDFNVNSEILRFTNTDGATLSVRYCVYNGKCWFELYVVQNADMWTYIAKSELIYSPRADEQLFCWLRGEGGLYDIDIENRGVIA